MFHLNTYSIRTVVRDVYAGTLSRQVKIDGLGTFTIKQWKATLTRDQYNKLPRSGEVDIRDMKGVKLQWYVHPDTLPYTGPALPSYECKHSFVCDKCGEVLDG